MKILNFSLPWGCLVYGIGNGNEYFASIPNGNEFVHSISNVWMNEFKIGIIICLYSDVW